MRHISPRTTKRRDSPLRLPVASCVVLAVMAGLMMLLPIDYRAETDHVHTHTIVQLWIDAATGRAHHHHGGHDWQQAPPPGPVPSELAAASVPRSLLTTMTEHTARIPAASAALQRDTGIVMLGSDAAASTDPDTAEPVTSHLAIAHAMPLGSLGVLVALLLAGPAVRPVWTSDQHCAGVSHVPQAPPPGFAPC